MRLIDYDFRTRPWPPPKDRRDPDYYLFGFDSDNQPYIVKWEEQKGYSGWVAATLSTNRANGATAVPRHYIGDAVEKLIDYWADAPALQHTVDEVRSERRYRYESEEY